MKTIDEWFNKVCDRDDRGEGSEDLLQAIRNEAIDVTAEKITKFVQKCRESGETDLRGIMYTIPVISKYLKEEK